MAQDRDTKSPLANLPRPRQAGEGLRDQINDQFAYPTAYAFGACAGLFAGVLIAWVIPAANAGAARWWHTAVFVIGVLYTAALTVPRFRQARRLKKGAEAERSVGHMLESLRADGYKVLHDLPLKGASGAFNADHIVIGPAGLFVIETKYASKPEGSCKVELKGEKVLVNGQTPERDPVHQVKAIAAAVRDELKKAGMTPPQIVPVLTYPGWWVNEVQREDLWLLNPMGIRPRIAKRPRRSTQAEIDGAAGVLSTLARVN